MKNKLYEMGYYERWALSNHDTANKIWALFGDSIYEKFFAKDRVTTMSQLERLAKNLLSKMHEPLKQAAIKAFSIYKADVLKGLKKENVQTLIANSINEIYDTEISNIFDKPTEEIDDDEEINLDDITPDDIQSLIITILNK